ncbi:hypothetical protein [Bacillus sp. JJ722]|uniref:hypothetical protein n=1 Tax=Bacillus sp. JJ722 TaxID=3122973 RepID=UPI002FFE2938
MDNKVDLTDDELSVIQASLQVSILAGENYLETNGLDYATKGTLEQMKALYVRLDKEYF